MHLNRKKVPKTWPIPKKGTKYIVSGMGKGEIPILIIIRDVMKLAKNRKEVKKILNEGLVKVNNKIVKDEKYPLKLYDILSLKEKNFRIILKNKKFNVEEIGKEKEKIVKVVNKRFWKKGKVQINLSDGRNIIVNEKEGKEIKIGDSLVIDLDNKKIKSILKFKEGCNILVIDGKHIGKEGKVEKIEGNKCIINCNGEKVNVKKEYIIVIK